MRSLVRFFPSLHCAAALLMADADQKAGLKVTARKLISESRAARDMATRTAGQLRTSAGAAGRGRIPKPEQHAASTRQRIGEPESSAVLHARQQEPLAAAKTAAEVLSIMLNNKKTVLEAGGTKSARQGARQFARAVEVRAEMLERLIRQMEL